MHNGHFVMPALRRGTIPGLLLLADWFAGLSLGFWAVRFMGDSLLRLITQAAATAGTLTGAINATMFPLFLSACAVFLFQSRGIYPVCLLRGLSLGLMMGAVSAVYGAGGWLLGLLLLFSGLCYSPVLLWFWRRRVCGVGELRRDTILCAGIAAAISAVDYLIISPFLVYVINL